LTARFLKARHLNAAGGGATTTPFRDTYNDDTVFMHGGACWLSAGITRACADSAVLAPRTRGHSCEKHWRTTWSLVTRVSPPADLITAPPANVSRGKLPHCCIFVDRASTPRCMNCRPCTTPDNALQLLHLRSCVLNCLTSAFPSSFLPCDTTVERVQTRTTCMAGDLNHTRFYWCLTLRIVDLVTRALAALCGRFANNAFTPKGWLHDALTFIYLRVPLYHSICTPRSIAYLRAASSVAETTDRGLVH